ncbi:MAG: PmoA family protein, partial [Planctomycetaceae bacterium]|nr:PmoA family protein [Planctomycetaceae bacterium]
IERPTGDRTNGNFLVRNQLMSEDGERVVCTEICRYRFEIVPEGMLIRIDAMYGSDEHDFYFGDQEESGLAVRVASPIRVQGGNGTIVNNRGERNGAEVWGKEVKWFDYFGTVDSEVGQRRQVGMMVVPSPNNPRPSWLHARDYGVVVTNPFPKQPKERREPYIKTWVKRGEPFRLSYAVLIHDQPNDQPLDHDAVASRLLKSFD